MKLLFLLLLILMPFCAAAKELYHIRPLSEREVQQTYLHVLEDACRYAARDWTNSSFSPAAGYWGDGVSSGNGGIRTLASMALACGTLLCYDDALSGSERRELLGKMTAALRYAAATHVTGTQKCTNHKQWGATPKFGSESWQSGMWTGTLFSGAWLVWDQLDPALQTDLERVMASESDILAERKPPTNLWLDTKAEENGWDVPCLVLGELMFPKNPRAAVWHEAALRYMMNTLSTEADMRDQTPVDGRPVSEWVVGANVQPDFTLQNHNIFHPAYVACSSYFLTQAAMYYTRAGRPIPQAASHHLLDTWRMFRTLVLPWGEVAYPQGMDWELHGLPYFNLYAALGAHGNDPFAARAEQNTLQYVRAMQVRFHGNLTPPGSRFAIVRHAVNAEQASYAFLAHKIFGASSHDTTASSAGEREDGVWEHPEVGFIAHRTEDKFASFSWTNRIMGLLMPLKGHEDNPDFTVPIAGGFAGAFDLVPQGDTKTEVAEHSWRKTPDGFETSGTLLLNGGRLKQTLRMISIGKQTVLYEDRVTALADVTVQTERGLPLGIENDEITGGNRTLASAAGRMVFDWQKPRKPVALGGTSWADVDGRLAVVTLAGSGIAYVQATNYTPGIAVYADVLYGSWSDQVRPFKAGAEVARRIAVVYVEVTPKEAAKLAQACKIEARPDGKILHFKQPDGKIADIPLLD